MAKRITVYLDENLVNKIEIFGNKSKIVKDALNVYLNDQDYFINEKSLVENRIKDYEYKLDNEKSKLDSIEKEIEKINKITEKRPDGYLNAVNTLKSLPNVTDSDLAFQAEKLHVDAGALKEFIWTDGYFNEVFRK